MIAFFYDSYILILFFLLPGIFLGAIYDVFRILRMARTDKGNGVLSRLYKHFGYTKPSSVPAEKRVDMLMSVLVFLEDILFCIIAALTEILLFYQMNDGVIRIYGLLLSFFGFYLYHISIGRLIIFFANRIIACSRYILYGISLIFSTPIVWLYRKTRKHNVK